MKFEVYRSVQNSKIVDQCSIFKRLPSLGLGGVAG
jgi:hypothetical protein